MGNEPKYNDNQRRSSAPANKGRLKTVVITFLVTAAVIMFFVGVSYAVSHEPISCGTHRTMVYAHEGEPTQTLLESAIRKMGVDPADVRNIVPAAQQARVDTMPGTALYVCLERGEQRVAQINDIQITK